ncbi:MAG: diguanylate cyclase [Gammaproteobacteria bacterium]
MPFTRQTIPLRNLFRFLMLTLVAIYIGLLAYIWQHNLTKTRNELNYINSYLVQAVRSTLKDHELILRGLGSELLTEGVLTDPAKGHRLLDRMKRIDPGMVGFGLARPDGQLILVTGINKNTSLPNLLKNPASEHSFREALASKHLRTGRPYYFKPLGEWVVPVRVAIRDGRGNIRAVMIAGYATQNATTAWNNLKLLPQVKVALIGSDGYPIYVHPLPAGSKNEVLQKVFGHPIGSEAYKQIRTLHANNTFIKVYLPRSGGENYLMYSRLPEYGLHAGAFVEQSVVITNWLKSCSFPSIFMLIILLSGSFAYRRASQQQRAANQEISKLSAWQQAVLDSADYAIVSTDTDGIIATYNKTAERLLGYRAREVIGKTSPAIFHDHDELEQYAAQLSRELNKTVAPEFEAFIVKARQGEVDEREWTYIRKDGTRFPVRLSVTPLKTDDGNIIGFMGIADDLSEQKNIQASLRDSEARYRTLFEHGVDANFLVKDDCFIDCNPATLKMFGCTREQIIGETPMRYSPPLQPDGIPSVKKAREKIDAAYHGKSQFFEWRHIRHDGTPFDAEITLNFVQIGGEPHILATVRDITERKRNEGEIERSRLELIQHNESLSLLNQLAYRLDSTLSLDEILHETMQTLLGLTNTPNIAIYLLEPGDDRILKLAASHGFPSKVTELGRSLPRKGSLSGLALADGKVMVTSDITDDMRLYPSIKKGLTAIGAHSGIIIPLFYQNSPLGTVNLIYTDKVEFGQLEKETLASLGNTLALSIANARHVENLAYQARHDSLTQLPNRSMLHETLNQWIERKSHSDEHIALLLLDLNHFKDINDTLGHQIGDRILTLIGERLNPFNERKQTFVARLGGDEFAIVVQHQDSVLSTLSLADEILQLLQQPFLVKGIELTLGASIGVAYFPVHGKDSHALLRSADVAMYQAKKLSSRLMVYDSDFDDYSTERLTLANELVQAVNHGQLVLHYQPKIDLKNDSVIGFEALVRWNHPRHGLLYPGDFIHLAEMSEIIHPFTRSVIELAVHDKQHLHKLGYHQPIAINLSAINLSDVRCLDSLQHELDACKLPAAEIEVELTETALMHEGDRIRLLYVQLSSWRITWKCQWWQKESRTPSYWEFCNRCIATRPRVMAYAGRSQYTNLRYGSMATPAII